MSFLSVRKDKNKRKGSVYIVSIEGKGLVIGTVAKSTKIVDIMNDIVIKHVKGRLIPSMELLRHKKCSDIIIEEARLNAELFDYYDNGKKYLRVGIDIIDKVW